MPDAARAITLTTPVGAIPGVRADEANALRQMGLPSVAHLVQHLPHRHEFEQAEAAVHELGAGNVISTRGEVTATRIVTRGARPRFEAVLLDHTGRLDLVWFNQTFLKNTIHPGVRLRVQGKAKRYHAGLQLTNPKYQVLKDDRPEPGRAEARLRPVYPATGEMPSERIEAVIASVLAVALPLITDHLPGAHLRERDMPALADAYRMMHAPTGEEETRRARRRLAYDELLLLQLGVHLRREHLRRSHRAPALRWTTAIDGRIRKRLPFTLTPAQDRVIREIAPDLTKPTPANRLIQGDVGSGKTVIALYAMLMAAAEGHQAALMAPTEVLAEQHFANISRLLEGSRVSIELLTGSLSDDEHRAALRRIASGKSSIVIGTHALLSESVAFDSLAVVIVDEQHRFGVQQRATLRAKAADPMSLPHTIVMTATPIPRTVSLTIFGDLDVSTLDGVPPGRKPIRTRLVAPDTLAEVDAYARARIEKGEQVFYVVPAVGAGTPEFEAFNSADSGDAPVANVHATLKRLTEGALAGLRVEPVHAQMRRADRDRAMSRFRSGEVHAIVATTVIEVGVDVPNATVMVIEQAERFGLAQLHQLRGRVGRGEKGGVCVLVADTTGPSAEKRLKSVAATTDGFALAETDFELRGPGDIFSSRQSGLPPFKVAELPRDTELLLLARRDAQKWVSHSPDLSSPADALVRSRLMKAYGKSLGLGDVA